MTASAVARWAALAAAERIPANPRKFGRTGNGLLIAAGLVIAAALAIQALSVVEAFLISAAFIGSLAIALFGSIAIGIGSLLRFLQESRVAFKLEESEHIFLKRLGSIQNASSKNLIRDVTRRLSHVLNAAAATISGEAKDPCAISVKLLWSQKDAGGRSPTIFTFCRTRSNVPRDASPNFVYYRSHTPFHMIIHEPARKGYCSADDLTALAELSEYQNANPSWKALYNSTAVRSIEHHVSGPRQVIGFVCVDTLWGKLSSQRVHNLLDIVSKQVHTCLQLIFLFCQDERLQDFDVERQFHAIGWHIEGDELECDSTTQSKFEAAVTDAKQFMTSVLQSGVPEVTELLAHDDYGTVLETGVLDSSRVAGVGKYSRTGKAMAPQRLERASDRDKASEARRKTIEFFRTATAEELYALDRRTREQLVRQGERPELEGWPAPEEESSA